MHDPSFSKLTCSVDLDKDGVQHGVISAPWSRDASSWGSLRTPVTVIKNGQGPTVLLTGANHGDEYEGPLALVKLRGSLDPTEINGRVIIIPALNLPAFRAGRRTSPIDGSNMNREFPGKSDGTLTQMMAHFVTTRLIPMADLVVDLHAGGRSLSFLPITIIHELPDAAQMERTLATLHAFGASHGLVLTELDPAGMIDTVVEKLGKVFLSTELGGAGTSTPETIKIAEQGIRNILAHAGVISMPLEPRTSQLLATPGEDNFIFAPIDGLFEFCAEIGAQVWKGDTLARIHFLEEPERAPIELVAKIDGMVICRHMPGLIENGDCAAVIAEPWTGS